MITNLVLVEAGDTLSAIAAAALGDPKYADAIAAINNLPNPDLIFPGMLLQLPTGAEPATPMARTETHLGKINKVVFGPDFDTAGQPLTLSLDLAFQGLGVATSVDDLARVREIMLQAGITDIGQLKGKPIQATRQGNQLVGWRILTEVL